MSNVIKVTDFGHAAAECVETKEYFRQRQVLGC